MSKFSKDFIWGVATSAGQIEGAATQDGRTDSIWDKYSSIDGKIRNNDTPAIANDSYNNMENDIKSLLMLGVDSYRFSTSWSRILPNGIGAINQKGLDYYKRLVDALLKNNIKPNLTMYHWDLPQVLQEKGGFLNRDIVNWFAEYSEVIYSTFGDLVPFISTFNEPIATYVGYGLGIFAPGIVGEKTGRIANHNLLLAHGESVKEFRSHNFKNTQIGIVVDVWNRHPFNADSQKDILLCDIENEKAHKSFLNPIFKGEYSPKLLNYFEQNNCMPDIQQNDMKNINQSLDFFGLNCYTHITISHKEEKNMVQDIKRQGGNFMSNGQEFYPKAVYENALMLRNEFDVKIPIYITENGCYSQNETYANGVIDDQYRIDYINGFVDEIARANQDGLDIRGYYYWSLMDNFEWTAGYDYKFGLNTLNRIPKKSAFYYKQLIADSKI